MLVLVLGAALVATAPRQESVPGVAPPAAPSDAEPGRRLAEELGLHGDLRLRYEGNLEQDGRPDRHRARARVRVGAEVDVTDELAVGLRLTTGDPDDPNSPHVDLGDALDSDAVGFDRYYAAYAPAGWRGGRVTAGKFAHGFRANPIYGELVWDADVQPEGIAASWAGADGSLALYAGHYVLVEQALADEASVFVAQAAARWPLGERTSSSLALGWYRYTDTTPDGSDALLTDDRGNALVDTDADGDPDAFASGFSILNPIATLTHEGWGEPVTFAAEWIHNLEAEVEEDSGWAVGVAVGRSREEGDWRAWYQLQHVERDAVFTPFVQDDFLLATNATGHVAGVQYRLADRVELRLWALVSARDELSPGVPTADDGSEAWRVRLDLNVGL